MSDNPIIGMKEQQKRRARIKRMKLTIVASIFGWMFLSMIICVILGLKVYSLDKQINKMYDFVVENAQNVTTKDDVGQEPEPETSLDDLKENVNDNLAVQFETDTSNLATGNEKRKVYLTFDDGPSENTEEILNILAKNKVKATFFVVGKTDEYSLSLYQRIVEEGHSIGMHSYTHKYSSIYSSLEAYEEDLEQLHQLILDTCGVDTKIVRFPGGSSNQVSDIEMSEFIGLVNEKGYSYYDWNVVNGDATAKNYTEQELVDNVIQGVEKYKTSIVLMHDGTNKEATVESLEDVIKELQKMDADILPINEETELIQHVKIQDLN